MLSKVLKKSTCADCRFCCSFRRCSLWETPLFPKETMEKLEKEYKADKPDMSFNKIVCDGFEYGQMELMYKYKTEDSEEEAACEFLDAKRGCVLSDEDKPFDCKIWPLRIMKKEDKTVIALTPTCPAVNKQPLSVMEKLVEEGLGNTIYEYSKTHPYIVKEYKEGFPVLMEF
mgnify:FL=1